MSINKSGTFTYSPDVSVTISTLKNGIIDVSADVISFTVQRNINAVSGFSCTLANPNRKYNRVINTMDRITVFLKRTEFVQVFTGYVTLAPIETLVPTPITINAYCTLRNLQFTYWDNTLIEYQSLLLNYMDNIANSSNQSLNDGGVAQVIVNLLYKVAGWDPSKIHITPLPQQFLNMAGQLAQDMSTYQTTVDQSINNPVETTIGSSGVTNGVNIISSGKNIAVGHYTYGQSQTIKNSAAPDGGVGVAFTVSKAVPLLTKKVDGRSKAYFPAHCVPNPVKYDQITKDIYYCSVPFSYITATDSKIVDNAKSWVSKNNYAESGDRNSGRLLVLENQKTNRVVVLRATSVTQKVDKDGNIIIQHNAAVADPNTNYVQCHPGVVAYLNGLVSDPSAWKHSTRVDFSYINIAWADMTQVSKPGPQKALEQSLRSNANSLLGVDQANSSSATVLTSALSVLMQYLRQQFGAMYSQDLKGPHYRETPNNPYTGTGGWFDCSGLIQWAYKQIGIFIGGNTWQQYGSGSNSDVNTHGLFIDKNTMPHKGDILFWNVPDDGGKPPQHVTILSEDFDNNGNGKMIQSSTYGQAVGEYPIKWQYVKGGGTYPGWNMSYMGARRPLVLHQAWGKTLSQNFTAPNNATQTTTTDSSTSTTIDPNNVNQRMVLSITDSWNTPYISPNWDARASVLRGSPRAFTLDNPLMEDLSQVINTGLRDFMSAPNGDFVAWFADYYGVYGTDPAIEISDVEIIDFQIYHNDDSLVTHVATLGDTTGIGQQVNLVDYSSTQGIVSIQDASTMQFLFGKLVNNTKTDEQNALIALNFLKRYGIRPYVQEQNVIHSHALEYWYALKTFMIKWTEQFSSNILLSFMPELYPGMRVVINIDNEHGGQDQYQFYCTQVTHQGDRSGGFTTQATLTAPIKNGSIMHYGLDFVT